LSTTIYKIIFYICLFWNKRKGFLCETDESSWGFPFFSADSFSSYSFTSLKLSKSAGSSKREISSLWRRVSRNAKLCEDASCLSINWVRGEVRFVCYKRFPPLKLIRERDKGIAPSSLNESCSFTDSKPPARGEQTLFEWKENNWTDNCDDIVVTAASEEIIFPREYRWDSNMWL